MSYEPIIKKKGLNGDEHFRVRNASTRYYLLQFGSYRFQFPVDVLELVFDASDAELARPL